MTTNQVMLSIAVGFLLVSSMPQGFNSFEWGGICQNLDLSRGLRMAPLSPSRKSIFSLSSLRRRNHQEMLSKMARRETAVFAGTRKKRVFEPGQGVVIRGLANTTKFNGRFET